MANIVNNYCSTMVTIFQDVKKNYENNIEIITKRSYRVPKICTRDIWCTKQFVKLEFVEDKQNKKMKY